MTDPVDPDLANFVAQWVAQNQQAMRIEGFGEDDPPAPTFNPTTLQERPIAPPPVDEYEPVATPALTYTPGTTSVLMTAPRPVPTHELWIGNNEASYKGQSITLSKEERATITQIVLRAIVNRAKAEYEAVVGKTLKRVRVRRARGAKHAQEVAGTDGGVRGGDGGHDPVAVGNGTRTSSSAADESRPRRRRGRPKATPPADSATLAS